MTNISVKYLKDSNNNVISPVVSASSVFDAEGNSIEATIGNISSLLDTINGEVI